MRPQATALERARTAAQLGNWPQAYDLLVEADATTPLTGPDLPLLAGVAYAAGHLDVTIHAWERAHAASVQSGDHLAAAGAAVRVAMHLLFDTALLAPVRGWLTRSERLLEGVADTPVHAWLAAVRSYERLLSGDFDSARHWARRAVDVGTGCEPAAAALGRMAEARSLILQGEVRQGLDLMNEAAVATVSGEIDPLSTGVVYCELVCALQALGQYDLAEQWTDAMERWHHGQPVGSLHGRCRVHRAEILRLRGSCVEAEHEALLACEELRPYLRREFGWPLTELGRIRFRRGDLQGAEEAFLAAHRAGWDPQPGLALLHLAHGDVARAAASIRNALDHPSLVPSKEQPPNSKLRRAPLLEAQVEIAIAAGEVERAKTAADELGSIASIFQSSGMAASATLARARVRLAQGEPRDARREFEAAVHQWSEIGAPYETALAHAGLGSALRADGQEEQARFEFQAASAILERIGATSRSAEAAAASNDPDQGWQRRTAGDHIPVRGGDRADSSVGDGNTFIEAGDYWSVAFGGRVARVRDSKGLRYLSRLLAEPGREFHVLDLVALDRPPGKGRSGELRVAALRADSGDAGEQLDDRAKAAYRRRLTEIDDDLAEAQAAGDTSRAAQAENERELLMRELSRAVGLGGRDRRTGSASERARSAVTRAIRHAAARIRKHHAALADHLDRTVRTGTCCVYLPDPRVPVSWKI
jgi:tetratricopeptide (TPR) repeat protein